MNSTVPLTADSPAWRFQTWAAFVLSLFATSVGIWWLSAGAWEKAFVGLGLWFTVSSSFALAKAERDRHEANKLSTRVAEHQVERVLRDLSKEAA
ncbi:MAG: hypothetical protein IT382_08410 [Deltaproteobacteria bacterium]|jgi:hypothetical protein|nr:hypothetical protein [Deltaproteobacteria bacterium]